MKTNPCQLIEWIPVSESLPPLGEEVMVALGFGKFWTARRHEDGFYRDGALIAIKPEAITHWAVPLKHPRDLS